MKFTVAALLATLATTCIAALPEVINWIDIVFPPNGTTLVPGFLLEFVIAYNQSLNDTFFEVEYKLCDYGNPPGQTNSFCNDPNAPRGYVQHRYKLDSDEPYPPSPSATLQKNITLVIPERIKPQAAHGESVTVPAKGFTQLSVDTIPDIYFSDNDKPPTNITRYTNYTTAITVNIINNSTN